MNGRLKSFGLRTALVKNKFEQYYIMIVEKGFEDNCQDDPYEISSPQNILKFLEVNSKVAV